MVSLTYLKEDEEKYASQLFLFMLQVLRFIDDCERLQPASCPSSALCPKH